MQMETENLRPAGHLLHAGSVAIVGASPKGRWPTLIFRNLKKGGYKGKIYLINPNYTELWEERCHPNLAALPEAAEHLLLLVPTKAVLQTLEEGSRLGSKAATIYSAGFGEQCFKHWRRDPGSALRPQPSTAQDLAKATTLKGKNAGRP